jgi:hypothetical protein
MSQNLNSAVAVISIDIGKNSFHVVGQDDRGAIVLRQKWSRGQIEVRLANMPPSLIGMEACVGAHHLSRKLKAFGHDARLMPAKYVRPYSKGQKNDFRDEEAIAEAVQRPTTSLRSPLSSASPGTCALVKSVMVTLLAQAVTFIAVFYDGLVVPGAVLLLASGTWLIVSYYGGWEFLKTPGLSAWWSCSVLEPASQRDRLRLWLSRDYTHFARKCLPLAVSAAFAGFLSHRSLSSVVTQRKSKFQSD